MRRFFDHDGVPTAEAVRLLAERRAQRAAAPTTFVDPAPPVQCDTLWRGLLRDGQARVLVVRATVAVQEAAQRLGTSSDATRLLGELLVGTLLVRSALNPEERLQIYLEHQGPIGKVAVDAWQQGGIRAYVARPDADRATTGFLVGEGTLHVSRTLAAKSYSSAVQLDGDGVDDYLMNYLLGSEQILSLVRSEVSVDADGAVGHALGYLVQLMPEGKRDDIAQITANLERLPPLHEGMAEDDPDARGWVAAMMQGFAWDQVAREQVAFRCRCSRDRMLSMLSSLPAREIAELSTGVEPLELVCDYCRATYSVKPRELKAWLAEPS